MGRVVYLHPRREMRAEGECRLSRAHFAKIARVLRQDAGFELSEAMAAEVQGRLSARLRSIGCADFDQYCSIIAAPGAETEREQMLHALALGPRTLFQAPLTLERLQGELLAPLIERARAGERVRLWCPDCVRGEDPYAVGLALLDIFPRAPSLDLRILATEPDLLSVAAARAGAYRSEHLAHVPAGLRRRWMVPPPHSSGRWRMGPEFQNFIRFRRLALEDPWPMRMNFNAIFLGDALLAFDARARALLFQRLARQLAPSGFLHAGPGDHVPGDWFEQAGPMVYHSKAH